jgi:FixJ family two-component response regulator
MLRRVLRLADYEVGEFATGDDFLASLAAQVPACVVLDVHMPGLSGLDVQARLQASHKDVPVVFITASDDQTLDKIVLDANGVTLLRKPFSSNELLNAVSATLRSKPHDAS